MLRFDEYTDLLGKAIALNTLAEKINAQNETEEVRELIGTLKINSARLTKILAKRVAGKVMEAT